MSFISPVASDASGQPKATGSQQSLGKDDFLKLLVTKLQNQDPMQPSDDSAFVAELAQFSSLEQMQNISDGITTANKWSQMSMQSINNSMASGLIGKQVNADFSGIYVEDGKKPSISFTTDRPASSITFTVKDSAGNDVTTFTQNNVAVGPNTAAWDATDARGNRVPAGFYTITAKGTATDGTSFTPSMSVTGVVDSVVYRDGAAYVSVNGMEIALGDINEIMTPK